MDNLCLWMKRTRIWIIDYGKELLNGGVLKSDKYRVISIYKNILFWSRIFMINFRATMCKMSYILISNENSYDLYDHFYQEKQNLA